MKVLAGCVTLFVVYAAFALFWPLLGIADGFICGWVLANVFPWAGEYVVKGLQLLRVEVALSQLPMLAAVLGFLGGFFKSSLSTSKLKSQSKGEGS